MGLLRDLRANPVTRSKFIGGLLMHAAVSVAAYIIIALMDGLRPPGYDWAAVSGPHPYIATLIGAANVGLLGYYIATGMFSRPPIEPVPTATVVNS